MINEQLLLEELEEFIEYDSYDSYKEDPKIDIGWELLEDIITRQPKLEDEIINELEALKKCYEDSSEEWYASNEFQMGHTYSDKAEGIKEAIEVVKGVCGIKPKYDEEAFQRIKGGYVYETTEEMLKDIVAVSEYFKEECKAIKEKYCKGKGE